MTTVQLVAVRDGLMDHHISPSDDVYFLVATYFKWEIGHGDYDEEYTRILVDKQGNMTDFDTGKKCNDCDVVNRAIQQYLEAAGV